VVPADGPLYPTSAVLRALSHLHVPSGDAVVEIRRTSITTISQTMDTSERKSVLIIGGGAVGAIAALNLEVGGLAEVTLVLRSNYNVVNEMGYTFDSCDHGVIKAWKPSVGMLRA
jgi:NADPH-dependent 2,4-dienoyl-CoA reductase/sulfur reductase-like enzyme